MLRRGYRGCLGRVGEKGGLFGLGESCLRRLVHSTYVSLCSRRNTIGTIIFFLVLRDIYERAFVYQR